jgi:hypothetical protein
MTGNFRPKQHANAGTGKTPRKMTREDRLAEELRANLKRRKAAARRQKEQGGEPPLGEGEA